MSYLSSLLKGEQIADVHVDSELTYLLLANGTQVTFRGLLIVEPARRSAAPRDVRSASIADGASL